MYYRMNYYLFFVLCIFTLFNSVSYAKDINFPVILVPGDGGTQLLARIDEKIVPHYICYRHTTGYFNLWLNLEELWPFVIECFVHNMKLVYNSTTRTTHNMPGVEVKIDGWGNTSTIDYLDATHWSTTRYFISIIEALEKIGFVRGKSIRGVPFDFRKAPNEFGDMYKRLKLLFEETYQANGNKPCVIIAHSMGNPVTLYFLNKMTQAWKDKYIHAFISLGAPWAGAVKLLRLMASGDNLGIGFVRALTVRIEQRSMPSSAWLMPSPEFWKPNEPLVVTPNRTYTVADYRDFFRDIGFDTGYEMRLDTQNLTSPLTPPHVTVHCLHGGNRSTPGVLNYTQQQWYDYSPTVTPDDGDGTVNIRSLRACLNWKKSNSKPVYHEQFDGVEHMAMLGNQDIIQYISKVLLN